MNKAQVRRTDLVELLADVGLSGSMHSIVSQGKVEAVLASKPDERRELVEEAAGLGKFKQRRHRAELKLARVAIQVERARDVEAEVRKRLRPLALQATAAERAEKLADEIARLRARIAELDLAAADARREAAEERQTAAGIARRSAQEKLQALLAEREAAEEELADAAGAREEAIKALYRLQGATERIALRQEGADGLLARLRADLEDAEAAATERTDDSALELERTAAAGDRCGPRRGRRERTGRGARPCRARAAGRAGARSPPHVPRSGSMRLRPERRAIETELADAAGGREGATGALYRLGTARERIAHAAASRRQRCASASGSSWPRREAAAKRPGPSPAELEAAANEATAAARARPPTGATISPSARRSPRSGSRHSSARSPSARESRPPRARSPTKAASWRSPLLDVESGQRARSRSRAWRGAPPRCSPTTRRRAWRCSSGRATAGLGSLAVLDRASGPAERVAELPVVALEELLSARVAVGDRRRGSASTRSAASSGSRARRPRPSCSSSRAGAASSKHEVAELQAQARLAEREAARDGRACRGGRGRVRSGRASPRRPRGRSQRCFDGSPPAPTGSTRH